MTHQKLLPILHLVREEISNISSEQSPYIILKSDNDEYNVFLHRSGQMISEVPELSAVRHIDDLLSDKVSLSTAKKTLGMMLSELQVLNDDELMQELEYNLPFNIQKQLADFFQDPKESINFDDLFHLVIKSPANIGSVYSQFVHPEVFETLSEKEVVFLDDILTLKIVQTPQGFDWETSVLFKKGQVNVFCGQGAYGKPIFSQNSEGKTLFYVDDCFVQINDQHQSNPQSNPAKFK